MKNRLHKIILVIMCFLTLTACNENINSASTNYDYKAKEGRCVVEIPEEYSLVYENNDEQISMRDYDLINAKTIEGKPKEEGFQYLSVLLNEPFRIMTPLAVIQNKNTNYQTLTNWIINGVSYEASDSYLSDVYSCSQNTRIEPVYSEFKVIGIIIFLADSDLNPKNNLFDEKGKIIEQENVKYLYGQYDFNPTRESWTTNMNLEYFNVSSAQEDNKKIYTISIKYDLTEMVKKGKVVVKSLAKIKSLGYMINPNSASQIIRGSDVSMEGTSYISLGEHTIEYTFAINM